MPAEPKAGRVERLVCGLGDEPDWCEGMPASGGGRGVERVQGLVWSGVVWCGAVWEMSRVGLKASLNESSEVINQGRLGALADSIFAVSETEGLNSGRLEGRGGKGLYAVGGRCS